MYTTEWIENKVSIDTLLKYYDHMKVENYCKNCENYQRIWSCPPHNFNTYDYLKAYKWADLYALKINIPAGTSKDDLMSIFQKERRAFGNKLMAMEDNSHALIAGNCYQCNVCMRQENKACILKDKRRYSLESLGLIVSEITSNLLGIELKWTEEGQSTYLVTVGALLK